MRLISRSWWIADKHTLTRTRQLEVSAPCPACSQPLLPLKLRNIPIDLASRVTAGWTRARRAAAAAAARVEARRGLPVPGRARRAGLLCGATAASAYRAGLALGLLGEGRDQCGAALCGRTNPAQSVPEESAIAGGSPFLTPPPFHSSHWPPTHACTPPALPLCARPTAHVRAGGRALM